MKIKTFLLVLLISLGFVKFVKSQCQANFTYTHMDGLTFNFFNSSTGSVSKIYWDFGDFTIDTINFNPTHVFPAAGKYKVTMVVKDAGGNICGIKVQYVVAGAVPPHCYASFIYKTSFQAPNYILWVINTSNNFNQAVIDFGDGFTTSEQGILSHQYQDTGYYEVCVRVLGDTGCYDYHCKNILIGNNSLACDARYSYSSNINTISFTDESVGAPTHWYWEFGDGTTSFSQNPVKTYTNGGYYKVKLSILNSTTGCMSKKEKMLEVGSTNLDCQADFLAIPIPNTDSVQFVNKSIGAHLNKTYWYYGDGTVDSMINNPKHRFVGANYYNVCLSVGNIFGCYNTICKTVLSGSNSNNCLADFIYSLDGVTKNVKFNDKSVGDVIAWKWYFGDGDSSSLKNPTHTYANNGIYVVTLKVTNTSGKKSTKIAVINVNSGTQSLIGRFIFEIGSGDSKANSYPVSYKGATFGDPARMVWSFGDGKKDSTTYSPIHFYGKKDTNYYVCLRVSDPIINQHHVYCSNVFVREAVGVSNNVFNKLQYLFTNPVSDIGNIHINNEIPKTISIWLTDLSGKKVLDIARNEYSSALSKEFAVQHLNNGMYLLHIQVDKAFVVEKILILH